MVRWALRATIMVIAVAGIGLGVDMALTQDRTARGATIGGVELGGLDRDTARAKLGELAERAAQPVELRTESGKTEVPPADLGLVFDADATTDRLMEQPHNPFTRAAALAGATRTVTPVVHVDAAALGVTLDKHRDDLERAAVEGGVHFVDAQPVADMPAAGRRVDRDAAAGALAAHWLDGRGVELPMEDFSPTVSADTVTETVDGPATRAMSAPVSVKGGRDTTVRLAPAQLGPLLTFRADGKGGLRPVIDPKQGAAALRTALARTEHAPTDATFEVRGGAPTVVPSRDGARIDWNRTLAAVTAAATGGDQKRTAQVVYTPIPPKLTTDAARKLGVKEVIGEFSTSGFTSASGENIRLVAAEVDGAVVKPGATFSLNTHTGPRGTAQGYVDSTIIDHGHAAKAVGGGISQFATTLYNAAYFAGLEDVDHTEHTYYITRYPEAREATVFEGAIDLQFRNNTKHGVYIETNWSPAGVTVRLWGTQTVEVQSITGKRYAFTNPQSLTLPKGDGCVATGGSRGFTTSNTRVITDIRTGREISRHTRTVKYDPEPKVTCK